jgi:chemotaxis response regulator CheB
MSIRILLAGDQKALRDILVDLIGRQPGMDVVGEAQNGSQAIDLVQRLTPDVVVMDINMPF